MKKLLPILIGLSLGGVSALSHAENLVEIYQQALASNPDLRKAAATRDAAYEKINESRSPLLPQLGLGANASYTNGMRDSDGLNSKNYGGTLSLTQTLFDMSLWRQLSLTEKQAGIQDVSYQSSQQTLMLESATAYFNVLRAIDALSYTESNKQAIYHQLDQTTQRFNVGLVAITDVQNARAQYDQVLANEVTARNNLDNSLENLRQITGQYYSQLASLNVDRFSTKRPENVSNLLRDAEQRNLQLLTARLNQDLAREQIKLAQTGYMPTLSLSASSGVSNTDYNSYPKNTLSPSAGKSSYDGQNQIGLNFNLPLYSGGATNSQVKQAQYNFVGASEGLESAHRAVVQNVRSSYNNITASISGVEAYKQAVISAQSSLDATQAGYEVGTRTIVDVLNATTQLYSAKQNLSTARYDYLISLLNMKYAQGSLNQSDLAALNNDLGKNIPTSQDSIAPRDDAQAAVADGNTSSNTVAAEPAPQPVTVKQSEPAKGKNPFRG
ncbi:outer membrane channel protein TolC [Enterobacillus tribolii]|uniref:Outer membrane protein TolC n=1 Tax=Enterobacillus tribolii TaxID=1487935 RepID=A0A370R1G7_9GAMM|nr:outer membrane channel protein TolC [Enterobacillus tribolii]MBW7983124.1 outer membrane channel protein TolC [Enterobacillus tribolii]RDK95772.1 outer membrane protein [Enterobacillus tribolii]